MKRLRAVRMHTRPARKRARPGGRFTAILGSVWLALHPLASAALAHGFDGPREERLNIGLVLLSFALIGAFVYLATQKGGRAKGGL